MGSGTSRDPETGDSEEVISGLIREASGGRGKAKRIQPSGSALHERMLHAAGDRTYRNLADLTGQHPETVRRYMSGQSPSADFLSNLCDALRINGDWLLTGRGPMKASEVRAHALSQANTPELFTAMATTLESLITRVDRLEVFVQTMETRLRVRAAKPNHAELKPDPREDRSTDEPADRDAPAEEPDQPASAAGAGADRRSRAAGVARAVAERSPPAAD